MIDDIERVPDDETDAAEAWQRLTDDPEIRGIEVSRHPDAEGWQVYVWVAEFLREDPLEAEFRQRMNAALGAVEGVASVAEEDREVWFVTGAARARLCPPPLPAWLTNWPGAPAPTLTASSHRPDPGMRTPPAGGKIFRGRGKRFRSLAG